ncbi:Mobile element protein [Candidatus Enterovibrio escicola]|uniref:Mobile element protein n=1 Tax=Candidatus Enterovibrio escicola TaxID=1927127 RepID=A0A2A5T2J9_9GAMM|nr:transposase [Candidatus Enterovibrio escacola]PCS22348.1 Mobile element protein [Candidatus Enterovibrio escacola]
MHHQARPTGISFVNSSNLQVCDNLRILRYQVFKVSRREEKKR